MLPVTLMPTKFGDRCTGCGGFIDITQNAGHVLFARPLLPVVWKSIFPVAKVRIVKEDRRKSSSGRCADFLQREIAARKGRKCISSQNGRFLSFALKGGTH
jgi:propionate CoA-transferase